MTINDALTFIHRKAWGGSKPGLSRTLELLNKLGDPQKRLRFVHIAGTNGKGSCAAMLSATLSAAGYKTGLYTSPYVIRFNERIQINGEFIADSDLCRLTERIASHALAMSDTPTEFELITALAMLYFAESGCDIIALEAGLGGRLDSTNVIDAPECAVIMNIGLDHMAELGDTAEKIAAEKCGIIKPGGSCVLYAQESGVENVVGGVCEELGVPLTITAPDEIISVTDGIDGQTFTYRGRLFELSLLGAHQLKNAAVVIDTIDILRKRGYEVSEDALFRGIKTAAWPARFEIVSKNPWFVIDGGHNPQCAAAVLESINKYFPCTKTVVLAGVMADKDYAGIFDILSSAAHAFITVTPDNPRSLDAHELAGFMSKYGKDVKTADSVGEGIRISREEAGPQGLVVCVGSLYLAGEVRSFFI